MDGWRGLNAPVGGAVCEDDLIRFLYGDAATSEHSLGYAVLKSQRSRQWLSSIRSCGQLLVGNA
ncbi:hypothetical protein E1B28_009424 [Marasmius oreades]|uniref:Uncharacterized protein n=1 Tax=Marasmius oreades TaxID=181124 RepID=A0A9P7S1R1_9AGAR|nr:uncharacterized protein E1B28_009424 [Marasmius oreades]KAG7093141.1 hypothetical protein E1B28_009424 [Marasmius oreades]